MIKKIFSVLSANLFFAAIFLSALLPADAAPAQNISHPHRYIVFFAQSPRIPQNVINKILNSTYFCLNIPLMPNETLSDNIGELIASGKAEISLSLQPEPIWTAVYSIYDKNAETQDMLSYFVKYNAESLKNKFKTGKFGLYLKSGALNSEMPVPLSQNKLLWVNASNLKSGRGIYKINGMPVFSVYDDMPASQNEFMKWLSAKKESVIPAVLTEKHLNSLDFMSYLIDLFDKSQYIKPASPLYITDSAKNLMINPDASVSFNGIDLNPYINEKLYSAVDALKKYRNIGKYSETSYRGAQSELLILFDYQLLSAVKAGREDAKRTFETTYDNLFRYLGFVSISESELEALRKEADPYSKNTNLYAQDTPITADISAVSNGINIASADIVRNLTVVSEGNSVRISIRFATDGWDSNVSFADIYIDMNSIDGLGSTSMLKGIKGFLESENGWEYAVRMYANRALLYRDSPDGQTLLAEFPVSNGTVNINRFIKGNPQNWAVQVIAVKTNSNINEPIDFLGKSGRPKKDILANQPFELPAIRLKKK